MKSSRFNLFSRRELIRVYISIKKTKEFQKNKQIKTFFSHFFIIKLKRRKEFKTKQNNEIRKKNSKKAI